MAAPFLSCRRVEQALEQPFVNARGAWTHRTSLELQLGDGAGALGHGEASPLPGYSPDDVDRCESALSKVMNLGELTSTTTAEQVFQRVSGAVPDDVPAARFALETAALDRLGRGVERPLWSLLAAKVPGALLGSGAPSELALCAVLPSADITAALAAARLRSDAGVRAFKLKVGPAVLQPAQERTLEALREVFGDSVELRVDANRSLARTTLNETFERLARYRPSFVEEPIDAPRAAELEALPCGFALDESLATASEEDVRALLGASSCRAVMLKPTLLGGFARCIQLARLAASYSRASIVSHALEGPVGFAACLHLALALPAGVAHGLWPLPHQLRAEALGELGRVDFARPGLGALG